MAAVNDHGLNKHISGPAENGFSITPADGSDLPFTTRKLYVGGAGDIKVDLERTGTAIILKAVPVGTMLEIAVKRVYTTGTTATLLVGLY